jgi:hypothetical protein
MKSGLALSLAAATALSACATITRGTKEVFVVETDPSGAHVTLSNGLSCEATPCSFKVPRRGAFVATIKLDGYETIQTNIESSVDTGGGVAMAGNVVLGGLIGAGVDAGTGAMHSHKPNPLVVQLRPISKPSEAENAADAQGSIDEILSSTPGS